VENKVCDKCGVAKPATDDYFPTMPRGTLRHSCRICMNERKGYKFCKKCGVEKPVNRDNFGGQKRGGFRGTCRACMRAYTAKHTRENPEMMGKRIEKRRAQGGRTTFPEETRVVLWNRNRGICLLCNKPISDFASAHVDHMTPVAKGGTNNLDNLCLAHVQCNKEKHNKTLSEHWEWRRIHNLN
jgi:5-methylcytosine-specific restriction endonuclease McrA